jgi:hypothetical protein
VDCRLEKVHHLLVLDVLWPVALPVEGAETGGMLRELVAPEVGIGLILGDPVPDTSVRSPGRMSIYAP